MSILGKDKIVLDDSTVEADVDPETEVHVLELRGDHRDIDVQLSETQRRKLINDLERNYEDER